MTTLGHFSDQHEDSELGRAQRRIAKAYGVPRAAIMVHGRTGAIAIALRAYKRLKGSLRVLVAPGSQHSILSETIEIGGELRLARGFLDTRFEACLPPAPEQLEQALANGPQVDLVVLTSPTREGFHARIEPIAEIAHRYGALLHVDSYGSLDGLHKSLPASPVARGADSASISVQGLPGELGQTALLTWSEEHLTGLAVLGTHIDYYTERPSYPLAASLDDAITKLVAAGKQPIDKAIEVRQQLEHTLNDELPRLEIVEAPWRTGRPPSELDPALDPAVPVDPLRLTLGFGAYQMSGFEIAKHLMKVGVVPEKAGVQTVTLAVPVDDDGKFSECVATEMIGLLAWRLPDTLRPELPNPLLGIGMEPVINPASAIERSLVDGIFVPLEEAAGGVCLEFIEVYPDSIPIAIPGFPLSRQAVAYLGAVVGAGGSIVSLVPGKASVLLESETL